MIFLHKNGRTFFGEAITIIDHDLIYIYIYIYIYIVSSGNGVGMALPNGSVQNDVFHLVLFLFLIFFLLNIIIKDMSFFFNCVRIYFLSSHTLLVEGLYQIYVFFNLILKLFFLVI